MTFKTLVIVFLLAFWANGVQAQRLVKTETFRIEGNCEMCQDRIEEALAFQKGVKSARWNRESKMATVVYRTDKTTVLQLKQAAMAVGHDTDAGKAADDVYKALPDCCQFRTKDCKETGSK